MQIKLIFFILSIFFSSMLQASPYVLGDKIENLALEDQFEKTAHLTEKTKIVLFNQDKKAGSLIEEALSKIPEGYLNKQQVVYISDISGMPSFISNFIAIPAMQQRNYPIYLDQNGSSTANFPRQEGMATLIYLDSLLIKKIVHLESVTQIRQTLELK